MFALNNTQATRGVLTLPERGVWTARMTLAADVALAAGAPVELLFGTLALTGVVEASGVHVSTTEVIVVGGRGGWKKPIRPKVYRADNGVRLSQVAADIASDTKERVVLEPGVERALGYAWTRAAGPGATALDELEPRWWVGSAGITHVGDRSAGARATAPFSVVDFDPAARLLSFSSPGDDLAAFPIGTELAGEGIGAFTIRSLEARFSAQRLRIKARG